MAQTVPSGRFELSSFGQQDGIRAGTYKVTVRVSESRLGSPAAANPAELESAIVRAAEQPEVTGDTTAASPALPSDVQSIDTTPIEVVVPVKGQLRIDLDSSGN